MGTSLAAEIRRRLGPPPQAREWPLVSIVVLNRDGVAMLRRLLAGLVERTDYPALELIAIDNASSDDSVEFLRRVEAPFPISIVVNPHNESFSDACNQGAEAASGELLLFLNNDVEPFEPGWLRELVACMWARDAGAVSATLICPDREHERSFEHGYGVQHRGLDFREEGDGMIHPALYDWEADPLDDRLGVDEKHPAVAAACVLVPRHAYEQVGGFSHGYVYGAEDVDLSLKLRDAGFSVVCSGRSLAIHHPVSTRRTAPFEEQRALKLANRHVLWERWGPRLRRDYEFGQPDPPNGEWLPGFCFKVADPESATRAGLDAIMAALQGRDHRCLLSEGDRAEDPIGLNYEIAVHAQGRIRYIPKSGQLNVLWPVGESGEAAKEIERSRYDFALPGDADPEDAARRLLAIAADEHRSGPGYLKAIRKRRLHP